MKLTTNQLFKLRNSINGEERSDIKAEVYLADTLGRPGRTIATARDRYGVHRELVIYQLREPAEMDAAVGLLGKTTLQKLFS